MIRLLVLILVLAGLPACASSGSAGTVQVLASWTGGEEKSFRAVLDAFEAEENIRVEYVGTRAVGQVLQSDVQQGSPPDIAVLPSPGELASYARDGYLVPLDDIVEERGDEYSGQWLQLEKAATRHRFAVAVKADLKSMIWYNPRVMTGPKPTTGEELLALGAEQWCLGMGAPPDSGWPGTDWIEDVLLHQAGPKAYRDWASGKLEWTSDAVRQAWTTWRQLLPSNRAKSALLTDFGDAGRPMFAQPPGCRLDHQASFIMGTYRGDGHEAGRDFDFFPFPAFGSQPPAWVVSADLAAMFNDTPQARKLISFLASERAQRIWPQNGGAFSVNRKVGQSVYGDAVSKKVADALTTASTLCFDASDMMPTTVRAAFYRAVLEYLDDPNRLEALLGKLETVRRNAPNDEWLDFPCGP